MLARVIFEGDHHQWIMFGRDPDRPERIIDTNQYMVVSQGEALLLDPGGVELFAPMLAAVLKFVPLEKIRLLFASHQDPDIISSLGLWDQVLEGARLYCPWLWEGFVRHFGMHNIEFEPIPDRGGSMKIGDLELTLVPAHFLHASGNFHVYDPRAKILFSGDVGASLEPSGAPLEVEDFERHVPTMHTFHRRWMPSNEAKAAWIRRVSALEIELMVPQHGRLFRGADVKRFLTWFDALEVGISDDT